MSDTLTMQQSEMPADIEHGHFTIPAPVPTIRNEHSRDHALARIEELMGCTEGSPEEHELAALADAVEDFEGC